MDLDELAIGEPGGDRLGEPERVVVGGGVAKGALDGVEEILAIDECMDSAR